MRRLRRHGGRPVTLHKGWLVAASTSGLGEHVDLRATFVFAGAAALLIAVAGWKQAVIRNTRALPQVHTAAEDAAIEEERVLALQPLKAPPTALHVDDRMA